MKNIPITAKVSSPLKQKKIVKVSESQSTGTVIKGTPGKPAGTANYDAAVLAEGNKQVDPKKITPAMTAKANKLRADAKAKDAAAAQAATPDVFIPGKKKRSEEGAYHRNSESTQFSRERSNSLRAAKNSSRKLRNAKNRGLTTTAYNEYAADLREKNKGQTDAKKLVEIKDKKQWKKDQKNLHETNYRNRNAAASRSSYEGAVRQIDANKSVLNRESYAGKARETTTADSKSTVQNSSDVLELASMMEGGKVKMLDTTKTTPNPLTTTSKMKTTGFFKGKSPLKTGYFKK